MESPWRPRGALSGWRKDAIHQELVMIWIFKKIHMIENKRRTSKHAFATILEGSEQMRVARVNLRCGASSRAVGS